jgi:hypothetical protein
MVKDRVKFRNHDITFSEENKDSERYIKYLESFVEDEKIDTHDLPPIVRIPDYEQMFDNLTETGWSYD